jgi:hypothetical protein
MKDWVPEFLRLQGDPRISEAELDRELKIPQFCRRRLVSLFRHNLHENEKLVELVGSVLADLNLTTFFDLLIKQNLFFAEFHEYGAALNIPPSERDTAVILLGDLTDLPFSVSRGLVAHEVGHLILGHHREKIRFEKFEEQADAAVTAEGFGDDISALRKFKEKGGT